MPGERDGNTERRDLTLLTHEQAEELRAKTYADLPPNTERSYSDHKLTMELFGCSIQGEEILCSFRVEGVVYRPEARAKPKGGAQTINVRIPAKVEPR